MLETKQFVRKRLTVEAVQVTAANMDEVAQWCGGRARNSPEGRHIKVNVRHPQSERQKQAYVGDWVLKAATGFKVYTEDAMAKSFDEDEIQPSRSEAKRFALEEQDTQPVTDSYAIPTGQPSNVFDADIPQELRTAGASEVAINEAIRGAR